MNSISKNYLDNYQEKFPKLTILKKLWQHDYWDGVISGVCLVNNEPCWFETIEQFEDFPDEYDSNFEPPWYRRFLVWKLTSEQFAAIKERHEKFRRMVGAHTTYDDNGKSLDRFIDGTVSQESTEQFYRESSLRSFPDYNPVSEDQIVGWHEWN